MSIAEKRSDACAVDKWQCAELIGIRIPSGTLQKAKAESFKGRLRIDPQFKNNQTDNQQNRNRAGQRDEVRKLIAAAEPRKRIRGSYGGLSVSAM